MYKLYFYVPKSHLKAVKTAVFESGAGKIADYEQCAWQTPGTGQYMPLENSNPYQGSTHQLESVDEYLVETVIQKKTDIKAVLKALISAHPYETPAYGVCKILTIDDLENE